MKVFVGLGNPGKQYEGTRHNAGRMFIDHLAIKLFDNLNWENKKGVFVLQNKELMLVKSAEYFMNESGKIIQTLGNRHWGTDSLYIAHDDLDIKLGEYKVHLGKGPEVHGGVNDIERVVGKEFWRIRIGIDNRGTPRTPGEEYVLQPFLPEDLIKLESVLDEIDKTITGGEKPGEDNGQK